MAALAIGPTARFALFVTLEVGEETRAIELGVYVSM
jgi:hypothetical protein